MGMLALMKLTRLVASVLRTLLLVVSRCTLITHRSFVPGQVDARPRESRLVTWVLSHSPEAMIG